MRIAGKVFVVTGGGNGMGRQVVLGLARRGARVAAVDLDEQGLADTQRLADGPGGTLSTHTVNVTDRTAVAVLHDQVISVHGQVDGVVNIAGIIHRFAPFTDLAGDELDRIIDVNFWGTVNMCRAFLPSLLQRPEANLTNMSSLSALIPFAGQTFYGASKGAVKQFSEGLYAELCDTNVRVVTVFPGNISTNLTGNSGVEMLDAGGRKVRSTTPEVAGEKIVNGIARDSFRVVVGTDARLLDTLTRFSAKRTTRLVAKQMKSVL
ncbi:SDR family NAD(P)-dependent oxidoreductase [Mycolicibacterium litorale]|uniref:Oxidoreductase n=1 Tax=Mycolicibacterium litorale TaxID=758802 RepID=A0AAD1IM69_9MYCO|nr:SDR family oxidoreductase [Mycolicibacterium litorale]MCV7417053.1 SDR family oxidoreductase [Mycolicibacterium litorale]TDY04839.1 short-subunit dehydrogenase [Mycolicibacterium litorale]BBY18265.1 oxidoreductase [Mycolicibacterium litorale]